MLGEPQEAKERAGGIVPVRDQAEEGNCLAQRAGNQLANRGIGVKLGGEMLLPVEGDRLAQHGSGSQAIVAEYLLLPARAQRHQPPPRRPKYQPCLHDMDKRAGGIGDQQRHAGVPQQRMQAEGNIGERRPRLGPREDAGCARMIRIERGSTVGQPDARYQAIGADAPAPAFRHLRTHPVGTIGRLAGLDHPVPGDTWTVDVEQARFLATANPRIGRRQVIAAIHQLVPARLVAAGRNVILFQAHLRVSRTCRSRLTPGMPAREH